MYQNIPTSQTLEINPQALAVGGTAAIVALGTVVYAADKFNRLFDGETVFPVIAKIRKKIKK